MVQATPTRRRVGWLFGTLAVGAVGGATLMYVHHRIGAAEAERTREARRGLYFQERLSQLTSLPIGPGDVVLVGDSLTERGEWGLLLGDARIHNHGISGDTAAGVLSRVEAVADRKPAQVVVMIGINDLEGGARPPEILWTYERILDALAKTSTGTKVLVQSVLPVRPGPQHEALDNRAVRELNDGLRATCARRGVDYLDVASALADAEGQLDARFTEDGVHLNGAGYAAWREVLAPAIVAARP